MRFGLCDESGRWRWDMEVGDERWEIEMGVGDGIETE